MAKGCETLRLVALQHQRVCHAVSQRIASRHLGLAALLQDELGIVKPEIQGVVLRCWRVRHVNHLFHQCQRRLLGSHPCLRTTVHRHYLVQHLLAVAIVHLRKLGRKDGVHLVFLQLMGNLHIGKGQESCREILCRSKGALARIGIEQHLVALRTVVFGQQAFADHPFAEKLSHLRFQHAAAQRQFTAGRCPFKPVVRRHTFVVGTS